MVSLLNEAFAMMVFHLFLPSIMIKASSEGVLPFNAHLPAYKKACKKIFGRHTYHLADVGIRGIHKNNNKMERLNGEIRDREKTFRGLNRMDTPIIKGMKVL